MKRKLVLAIFLTLISHSVASAENLIDTLRNEPVNMFEYGLYRLQNSFFLGRDIDATWFKKNYPKIEFTLDMVRYHKKNQIIVIVRDINAKSNLINCTIAVETLRKDLTQVGGINGFIKQYFWHDYEDVPTNFLQLKESIYLVGSVYDEEKGDFFTCKSRIDKKDIQVTDIAGY